MGKFIDLTGMRFGRLMVIGKHGYTASKHIKRDNYYLTYNGKTQTMKQWVEEYNINYYTLRGKIYRQWDIGKEKI